MTDHFDDFIDHLQQQIFKEARQTLGKAGFHRWRNPKFNGRMENFDAMGKVTGTCGDTMEIYLKFNHGRVAEASYVTDGCGSSSVCGSFAAEMAIGHSPDEIAKIDGETVLLRLGRFPKEDEHCAFLAAEALQEALQNYMMRNSEVR